MHRITHWLLLPVLAMRLLADPKPLASTLLARRAAAMLGPTVWKQVIVIRNSSRTGPYPRLLGGVVFEMSGILWLYTPFDGTQSLSLQLGQTAADRQNLGPLLRQIDPGFTRWEFDRLDGSAGDSGPVPPHACFLECLELLRLRLAAGITTSDPRLLSYYIAAQGGLVGHTVLTFETGEGPMVIDPHFPKKRIRIRVTRPDDAKSVADFMRGDIVSARWVAVDPTTFAAVPPRPTRTAAN
jgi:hypothetical protein